MTQSEYAAQTGLTKGRVSQLVKAGMPLTSREEADAWRGMTAKQRAPSHPRPAPKRDPPPEPSAPPANRGSGRRKRSGIGPPPEVPTDPENIHRPGVEPVDPMLAHADTPAGAYERQKQIEMLAYHVARSAVEAQEPYAGIAVGVHAKAAGNLIEARKEVLKLAERERSLVSGDWVRDVMTRHDGAVATLLRAMPRQLAARISPQDPEHAERELERWVQEVALATFNSTDPWKDAPEE